MREKIQAIHGELRGAAAAQKDDYRWSKLLDVARGALRDEAMVAQLEEEVWPALEQELDRSWPAIVRVVSPLDPPLIRRLGRTLELRIDDQTTRALGAQMGLKLAVALNKRTIRELASRWLDGARWQGLILSGVEREHEALMQGLIGAGLTGLKHLRIQDTLAPHEGGLLGMVSLALDVFGSTLESYGATLKAGPQERLWAHAYQPLLDRLDALPVLDHLWFPWAPSEAPDMFEQFMAHPALERLSALSFSDHLSPRRIEILISRAASLNLRRVRQTRLIDDEAQRAFIRAPNMAGVEVWDIEHSFMKARRESWDTPAVDRWRAELGGVLSQRYTLDAADVELRELNREQLVAALFDGERLRGSTRLESLRMGWLDDVWMLRMAERAHDAWPKLRRLKLESCIPDEQAFEAWARSPLLHTLHSFELGAHGGWPYNALCSGERVERRALEARLLTRCLDPALPPLLARHLLESVLSTTYVKADVLRMARALGVPSTTGDWREIKKQCHAHLATVRAVP